jgi:hypothetical protein
MTSEQRLDRLERIAKVFVRAGVRYRRDLRELGDKLNIMVDMQIKNLERFKQNEAAFQSRSAEYEARFTQNEAVFQSRSAEYETRFNRDEARLAKFSEQTDQRFAELAESQTRTDRSLAELIKIVTKSRNGNPQTDS